MKPYVTPVKQLLQTFKWDQDIIVETMMKAASLSPYTVNPSVEVQPHHFEPFKAEGMSFKDAMEMVNTQVLSLYNEKPLLDLRPSSGMATTEAALGDAMQVTGAPLFTRHSNPFDTELEINLMDELAVAFGLPESFWFGHGGLGIININENDSLFALYYSAKFAARNRGVEVPSNKFVIYFPEGRDPSQITKV